jgi:hypothetical protein
MRVTRLLVDGVLVNGGAIILVAVRAAVALAGSEPGPAGGEYSPFRSNLGFYLPLFGCAAVVIAIGVFALLAVARSSRGDGRPGAGEGDR